MSKIAVPPTMAEEAGEVQGAAEGQCGTQDRKSRYQLGKAKDS